MTQIFKANLSTEKVSGQSSLGIEGKHQKKKATKDVIKKEAHAPAAASSFGHMILSVYSRIEEGYKISLSD